MAKAKSHNLGTFENLGIGKHSEVRQGTQGAKCHFTG